MASLAGRDISKLKAKGGGKWKYMSEKDMLEMAEKFAPYRCVCFPFFLLPSFLSSLLPS